MAREAIINKEESANVWRDGWTENTGPVIPYSLAQGVDRRDQSFADAFDKMANTIKTTHNTAEQYRQDTVDAQENADAWRKGTTPSSGPVSLVQGVDDRDQGYYDSYSNMANGVHTTHSNAEAFRQAVVN
jgi:hypothetical protein|tara:strand:+ start:499 stop:888 length:390 start_codon:yes stop_codon:yes gene_type:complete